jgi:hypothetical protein
MLAGPDIEVPQISEVRKPLAAKGFTYDSERMEMFNFHLWETERPHLRYSAPPLSVVSRA